MKIVIKNFFLIVGFCSFIVAENASYSGHIETSYERLFLPEKEPMGLIRVGTLFDVSQYLSIGPELYGAVYGQRGGFFTVGMEGRVRVPLFSKLEGIGGLYIGAGGGGSAPQGGGLMIHPSLGLTYDMDMASLEAGVSRVWYPNGQIDSTQLYVGVSVPFEGRFWRGDGWGRSSAISYAKRGGRTSVLPDGTKVPTPRDIDHARLALDIATDVLIEHYAPASGVHNVHSVEMTEPFSLAGVEFVIGSDAWYGILQAAGAGAGKATGYMELFGGGGYRMKFGDRFSAGIQAALGAAGGGKIDTGGGLMYRVDGVAETTLFDHVKLGVRAGTIASFGGDFSATSYGATLGYRESFYGLGDPWFDGEANLTAWRFRLINKSYLPTKGLFNDDQVNRIDLIGIALNRFLTPNLYLTGESFWAWQGQAGGYAEGVFGLSYQTDGYRGFHLYAEALAGVGGGGDVHMDGGLFGSLGGGIIYDIDDATQLYLGAAYVRSRTGGFRTKSIDFGVQYTFSLFSE